MRKSCLSGSKLLCLIEHLCLVARYAVRQVFLADIIILKTMERTVLRFRQSLVSRVWFLTVAKTLLIGFVVLMCFLCSAGKS